MKPEFCIGISKHGVLYEGVTAKALYRECPKYDHSWYAGQADWIVTEIELHARPVSAKFRAAFHNPRFRELRESLSRLSQARTGLVDCTLTAHDRETELSIVIAPNKDALKVAFALTRRWQKIRLQFETERYYDDMPEIVLGLDQIDDLFPVVGTGGGVGPRNVSKLSQAGASLSAVGASTCASDAALEERNRNARANGTVHGI